MPMPTWPSSLPSKYLPDSAVASHIKCSAANVVGRQHPAVVNQPQKIFVFVAQALEAEALSGQTASRVVAATQMLLTASNTDPTPLLQQFSPEAQQVIRVHFG